MTIEMLNRSAVIVKPRQPYLEWTKQDDAEGLAESVFETFHTEPTIYLLPEWEDPSAQHKVLERNDKLGVYQGHTDRFCGSLGKPG